MFIIIAKSAILWGFAFFFLRKQRFGFGTTHIGNMTAYRAAGLSLKDLLFKYNNGVIIPILSLSLQYDRFKNDICKYIAAHNVMVSLFPVLLYFLCYFLTGNEYTAFLSASIYALTFLLPIAFYWQIETEHYELLFFFIGANVLLAGAHTGIPLLKLVGSAVMGLALLSKFPSLISLWFLVVFCMKFECGIQELAMIAGSFMAPSAIYMVARIIYNVKKKPVILIARKGTRNPLSRIFGQYMYRYYQDKEGYIRSMFTSHGYYVLIQFIPIFFLAGVYAILSHDTLKPLLLGGLVFTSLIFGLRLTLWYTFSPLIILCIMAGSGLEVFAKLSSIPAMTVFGAALLVAQHGVYTYPSYEALFKRAEPLQLPYSDIASFMRENMESEDSWFFNVNQCAWAYVYLLSGKGFPHYFSTLLMGIYGPISSSHIPSLLYDEGAELLERFLIEPPTFILQSPSLPQIVNLIYIQFFCDLKYVYLGSFNNFAVFKLADRITNQTLLEPAKSYDPVLLFDDSGARDYTLSLMTSNR